MIRLEPALTAYKQIRRKRHGITKGSHLRALKMSLAMFSLSNGVNKHWYSRLAFYLAIHGTPRLRRPVITQSKEQ